MNIKTHVTSSSSQTRLLGRDLAKQSIIMAHDKPVVIMLYGQLGAGKTTFVKGIGETLGIDNIVSPTFVIVHEYRLRDKVDAFYHIDLYRITEESEFDNLGIVENLLPKTIACIEWSENILPISEMVRQKAQVIEAKIECKNGNTRLVEITYL